MIKNSYFAPRIDYKTCHMFEQNGLLGVKDKDGNVVEEPIYDQVEFCEKYLYLHKDNHYKKYWYTGGSTEGPDHDDDYTFIAKGKVGLLSHDRKTVVLPAVYDEIKEWDPYDVIYVRNGEEFHYFNHEMKEILTDFTPIKDETYPTYPFSIGEDNDSNVIVTQEFVKEYVNSNCVDTPRGIVKFDRIPYKDVSLLFQDCDVIPAPKNGLRHFLLKTTYIYAGFIASSKSKTPIQDCIKQLLTLCDFNVGWWFIFKIQTNKNTKLPAGEIDHLRYVVEDTQNSIDFIDFIAWGTDDNLEDGEVRITMIRYFTDHWPSEAELAIDQQYLTINEFEEIKAAIREQYQQLVESGKLSQKEADDIVNEELSPGHIGTGVSEWVSWNQSQKLLEYKYTLGYDTKYMIHSLCQEMAYSNAHMLKKIKNALVWAYEHGSDINAISYNKTGLEEINDSFYYGCRKTKKQKELLQAIRTWMLEHGAKSRNDVRETNYRELAVSLYLS